MNESNNKRFVIVGIFIFIALLFLGAGVFIVGDLHKTFEKKIEVVSLFDDVAGLQRGNNIWLSGVKVGIVSNLAFFGNSKVKVTMQIDTRAKQFIPGDSKVKISSDGLIGNKILVIYGGSENAEKLFDGDTLLVEKTISSEDMLNTLQKSNENILAITNDFKTISKRLVNGEGAVGKLFKDETVYDNINAVTVSLQQAMEKARQMINTLATFSTNLNKEGTLVNELTTDTVVFNSLKASVLQLQQIADTASVFITYIKQEGSNPKTSLGVLLNDEESGDRLKETIKNLEGSSQKLEEDLEALQHSFPLKGYFKRKTKKTSTDSIVNGH
jgi:phospholipid/cholesterol/gamma-HCH transport system substrate-binding protein